MCICTGACEEWHEQQFGGESFFGGEKAFFSGGRGGGFGLILSTSKEFFLSTCISVCSGACDEWHKGQFCGESFFGGEKFFKEKSEHIQGGGFDIILSTSRELFLSFVFSLLDKFRAANNRRIEQGRIITGQQLYNTEHRQRGARVVSGHAVSD